MRILVFGPAFAVGLTVCVAAGSQDMADSRYRDIDLAKIAQSPQEYDQMLVRVHGVCQIQFEGNVLWVGSDPRGANLLDQAVWLDVGWPVSDDLKAMTGTDVIVEARFDANSHGHMGCCRGTLTDIRAIWRPGFDSSAHVSNYETRVDALEQLKFKTGWIMLGTRGKRGYGVQMINGWIQTWFEFIVQPGARSPKRIPKSGDRIRLTGRQRIHILDYAVSDERRRLESPMADGRNRQQRDETRLWLASGSAVQVADVRVAWAGPMAVVWARVVPLTQK